MVQPMARLAPEHGRAPTIKGRLELDDDILAVRRTRKRLGVGPALDGSGQHLSEWSPDASDEAVPIFFRHRLLDELSRLFPALGIVS